MRDRTGELVEQYTVEMTDRERLDKLITVVSSLNRILNRTVARVVVLELTVAELNMEVVNLKSLAEHLDR